MKLSFQEPKKYAGILDLPALCKLQDEFTVEYTAIMMASASREDQRTVVKKAKKSDSTQDCSVRIIVYGVKSEENSVSDLLSNAGLYLQHPSAAELDRQVDYQNPQYLSHPGSQMPKLETLSISPDMNSVASTDLLDETHKSCFVQIFNSANGPSSHLNIKPSSRLLTTLTRYVTTFLRKKVTY